MIRLLTFTAFIMSAIFGPALLSNRTAMAEESFAADFETKGIKVDKKTPHLPKDLWKGLTRQDAIYLIKSMPDDFTTPVLRDVFRLALLADADSFASLPQDKGDKKADNVNSDFILLRLQKLYRIGAIQDATQLYNTLFPKMSKNPDIAIYGLYGLLNQGKLAPACLDVQAMNASFETPSPLWADMVAFCDLYYQTDSDEQPEKHEEKEAEKQTPPSRPMPIIDEEQDQQTKLQEDLQKALENERGPFKVLVNAQAILNKEVSPNLYKIMSLPEKLLFHASGQLSKETVYSALAQEAETLPLFDLHLLAAQRVAEEPLYPCVAQTAYKKGLLSADALMDSFRLISFDKDLFEDNKKDDVQKLPSCTRPAWYLQWIEQAHKDIKLQRTRVHHTFHALLENHTDIIGSFYSKWRALKPQQLGEHAMLAGLSFTQNGKHLPESWKKSWSLPAPITETKTPSSPNNPQTESQATDSQGKSGKDKKESKKTRNKNKEKQIVKLAPYWYLAVLEDPKLFNSQDFMNWHLFWGNKIGFNKGDAPVNALSLLKNVINLEKYQETKKQYYEKFFSLTFYRNYAISSYSLTARLKRASENNDIGEAILLYLHALHRQSLSTTHPDYLNGMIDTLKKSGLTNRANILIVHTLSVGK